MRQYFDLIHNQERVEYLMLQQNVIEKIITLEQISPESAQFLSDSDTVDIKHKLNTSDGINYYEQFIGNVNTNKKDQNDKFSPYVIMLHLVSAIAITSVIVTVVKYLWNRYFTPTDHISKINFDCEQAILKK